MCMVNAGEGDEAASAFVRVDCVYVREYTGGETHGVRSLASICKMWENIGGFLSVNGGALMERRGLRRVVAVVAVMVIISALGYIVFIAHRPSFLTWLWGALAVGPFCLRTFRPDLLSPLEAGFISHSGVFLMWFDVAGAHMTTSPLLFGGMFILLVGAGVYMLRNNMLIS